MCYETRLKYGGFRDSLDKCISGEMDKQEYAAGNNGDCQCKDDNRRCYGLAVGAMGRIFQSTL